MDVAPTPTLLPDRPLLMKGGCCVRFLPIVAFLGSLASGISVAVVHPPTAAAAVAGGVVGGCALCCVASHGGGFLCAQNPRRWTFHRVRHVPYDNVPTTFAVLRVVGGLAGDMWGMPILMFYQVARTTLHGTVAEYAVASLLLRFPSSAGAACDGGVWAGGAIAALGIVGLVVGGPCVAAAILTRQHGGIVPPTRGGSAAAWATFVGMFLAPLALWRLLSVCACVNGAMAICEDVPCGSSVHIGVSIVGIIAALILLIILVQMSITVHPIAPSMGCEGPSIIEAPSSPRHNPRIDVLAQCMWLTSRCVIVLMSAIAPTVPWLLGLYACVEVPLLLFAASRGTYFSNVRIINELAVRAWAVKTVGWAWAVSMLALSFFVSKDVLQWIVGGALGFHVATCVAVLIHRYVNASRRSLRITSADYDQIPLEL